jgi:hypothetical protein
VKVSGPFLFWGFPHAKGAKDGKGILKFGKGKPECEKKFDVKVKNCSG